MTQRIPNFATTTITASLSQDTSARHAEGIGQKVGPSETSLLVVAVGRTKRFLLLKNQTRLLNLQIKIQ